MALLQWDGMESLSGTRLYHHAGGSARPLPSMAAVLRPPGSSCPCPSPSSVLTATLASSASCGASGPALGAWGSQVSNEMQERAGCVVRFGALTCGTAARAALQTDRRTSDGGVGVLPPSRAPDTHVAGGPDGERCSAQPAETWKWPPASPSLLPPSRPGEPRRAAQLEESGANRAVGKGEVRR